MPLVPALCTQCNAKLEIDSSQEAAVCPYCKTPFITEKAINHYNTTNITNIDNLHADVVNISDDQSRDNRVKSGETFIKFNDYASAQNIFTKLTEDCPYDYRGWWGLIQVYSKNFTDMDLSRAELTNIEVLFDKVCTVATAEEKATVNAKYNVYFNTLKNKLDTIMIETNQKIRQLSDEFNRRKNDLVYRMVALEENEKNSEGIRARSSMAFGVGVKIFIILLVVGFLSRSSTLFVIFGPVITLLLICGGISMIFSSGYGKKAENSLRERSVLEKQLRELQEKHDAELAPLNEILRKVGIEQ